LFGVGIYLSKALYSHIPEDIEDNTSDIGETEKAMNKQKVMC